MAYQDNPFSFNAKGETAALQHVPLRHPAQRR